MKAGKLVNFKLADDYLTEVDRWRTSPEITRSEAIRIAIKTLKGQKIVKTGLGEYGFVKDDSKGAR
jgi:hypothetical protein